MKSAAFRNFLIYFAALCYAVFLILDFLMPDAWQISSGIKYAGLLACVTIAITGNDNTLRAAMLLTAACDYLLLFTQSFVPGVLAFACVQALHVHRHAKLAGLKPMISSLPACVAAVIVGIATLLIARDQLFAASAAYAVLLLAATGFAISAMVRRQCDAKTAAYASGGMLLFVLCDICVAATNLGIRSAAPFMWAFYLPSQWFLASSAPIQPPVDMPTRPRRKGRRG